MSPQSKSKFWSASAWKARLKRDHSSESTTSTADEFYSAHSSIDTKQTDQTEVLTRYSSSVYSKDEDDCSVVLPPSDDKKEDLDEYYLVSLPYLPLSLTSHLPNRRLNMTF